LKSSWTQNGVHQWHSRIFPSSLLVPRTFAQPQAWVDAVVHQVLADQAVWVRCLAGTCLSLPLGGPFPVNIPIPCHWTHATMAKDAQNTGVGP
jgi:hypothetical protein